MKSDRSLITINFSTAIRGLARDGVIKSYVSLGISCWNVYGLKSNKVKKIRANKSNFFSSLLKKNDLICFCETWRDKSDPVEPVEHYTQ